MARRCIYHKHREAIKWCKESNGPVCKLCIPICQVSKHTVEPLKEENKDAPSPRTST